VEVAWAGACGGGPEVGGDGEGVALAIGLVEDEVVATPSAATAAAREELGGEATGADWFVAGGMGVAPQAGVLMGAVWIAVVAGEGVAPGEVLVELQLLWGEVALCWAGVPASLSTSMGEASEGGIVDAAAAYKWEQQG